MAFAPKETEMKNSIHKNHLSLTRATMVALVTFASVPVLAGEAVAAGTEAHCVIKGSDGYVWNTCNDKLRTKQVAGVPGGAAPAAPGAGPAKHKSTDLPFGLSILVKPSDPNLGPEEFDGGGEGGR